MRPVEEELAARARHWKTLALVLMAVVLVLAVALGFWKFSSWQSAIALPFRNFPSWWLPATFVATTILLLLFLWHFPKWQVRSIAHLEAKERFDRENEARKTLSQIVGGLVLLIGFYFTWQNLELTRESQTDAQKAAQKNLQLAFQGQITDRFSKAIAQLGDDKLELRLGGIYALEGIAKESSDYHWPVMEVLTAYIREHANLSLLARSPFPAPDIQAILTVIRRRTLTYEIGELNQHLDLSGAHLSRANLSDADLVTADLREVDLSDADLRRADLRGANLRGAQLAGVDFSRAHLEGADLSEAHLKAEHIYPAPARLSPDQLESTRGDAQTELPYGVQRPKSWQ